MRLIDLNEIRLQETSCDTASEHDSEEIILSRYPTRTLFRTRVLPVLIMLSVIAVAFKLKLDLDQRNNAT